MNYATTSEFGATLWRFFSIELRRFAMVTVAMVTVAMLELVSKHSKNGAI